MSWVLWALLERYQTQGGGCRNSWLIPNWLEVQVTTWNWWLVPEVRVGLVGLNLETCEICADSGYLVSELYNMRKTTHTFGVRSVVSKIGKQVFPFIDHCHFLRNVQLWLSWIHNIVSVESVSQTISEKDFLVLRLFYPRVSGNLARIVLHMLKIILKIQRILPSTPYLTLILILKYCLQFLS